MVSEFAKRENVEIALKTNNQQQKERLVVLHKERASGIGAEKRHTGQGLEGYYKKKKRKNFTREE